MRETGSHWIRAITNPDAEHVIIVARITSVEIMSAVSRLRRENSISMGIVEAVQLILNRHMRREYVVIELTDAVTKQAINLLSAYPLRAYDSVQLASALES